MVGLRAKVLGRLGRKPSPHPRASALSCPSLDIYRPELPDGAPAFIMLPLLAASYSPILPRRGPSLCRGPVPHYVSYVHHGHKSAKAVHKKRNARRRGRPSPGAPGPSGPGLCGVPALFVAKCYRSGCRGSSPRLEDAAIIAIRQRLGAETVAEVVRRGWRMQRGLNRSTESVKKVAEADSAGVPGSIGPARCGLSLRSELRLIRVLRTSHVRRSRKVAFSSSEWHHALITYRVRS